MNAEPVQQLRARFAAEVIARGAPQTTVAEAARVPGGTGAMASFLVERGVAAGDVLDALSSATGVARAPVAWFRARPPPATAVLDQLKLWALPAAPIAQGEGVVCLAFAHPEMVEEARSMGLPPFRAYVGLEVDVKSALERAYGPHAAAPQGDVFSRPTLASPVGAHGELPTVAVPLPAANAAAPAPVGGIEASFGASGAPSPAPSAPAAPGLSMTGAWRQAAAAAPAAVPARDAAPAPAAVPIPAAVPAPFPGALPIEAEPTFGGFDENTRVPGAFGGAAVPAPMPAAPAPAPAFAAPGLPTPPAQAAAPLSAHLPSAQPEATFGSSIPREEATESGTHPVPMVAGPSLARPFPEPPPTPAHTPTTGPLPTADGGTSRLEDYDLLDKLGEGGMATVYLAVERHTGRRVALKLMQAHLSQDPTFVERFVREVQTSATLVHPNIVRVYSYGQSDGTYFMAMELVEGGTAFDLLRRVRKLPQFAVAKMMSQILAALGYAHRQGIIHRDLKPANVLITAEGDCKLTDFGIAKTVGEQGLTKTGDLVGTPSYMSPEQILGQTIDQRSDLFSIGIVAYHLLTGRNPYHAEQAAQILMRIVQSEPPQIFDDMPHVDPRIEYVLDGLLQKDPEDRFATADDALEAVTRLVAEIDVRYPGVVAEIARTPDSAVQRLNRDKASTDIKSAKELADSHPQMAALFAYRASLADPGSEATGLFQKLCVEHGFNFAPSEDPRILELEAELKRDPASPGVLKRLSALYIAEGNLHRGASYLKRYLKVKPNDIVAKRQLTDIVGEQTDTGSGPNPLYQPRTGVGPGPAVRRPPTQQGASPSTAQLLDGVKTGGFKAQEREARTGVGGYKVIGLTGGDAPQPSGALVFSSEELHRGLWSRYGWKAAALVSVVLVCALGYKTINSFVKDKNEELKTTLDKGSQRTTGVISGFVNQSQRPFLEAGDRKMRVFDYRGAVEDYNFAIAADVDMKTQASVEALLGRGEAHLQLGNNKQARMDLNRVVVRTPPGDGLHDKAKALLGQMDGVAPPKSAAPAPPAPGFKAMPEAPKRELPSPGAAAPAKRPRPNFPPPPPAPE